MKTLETIDPKDVATWTTTSSSTSGGGGSHPGNNNNETGSGSGNSSDTTINPPDVLIGIGGLSIDKDSEKE